LKADIARFEPVDEPVPVRKHVAFGARDVILMRDGVAVADVPVSGTTVDVVVSPDGQWVWRLSEEESAQVALLNGHTLETIGVFIPREMYEEEDSLAEWYEHSAAASVHAPDTLIVSANAGDSFVLLLTLRATADGIVDAAGRRIFDAVVELLDEVIEHASFVSPDRLLVVDDIGWATLLSWPDAEVLSRVSVSDTFSTDEGYVLWPDDEPVDDLVVGVDTFATDSFILLSVCAGDAPEELLAFAALDRDTLEVRGIIRPPVPHAAGMRQVGTNRFVVSTGEHERLMTLRKG